MSSVDLPNSTKTLNTILNSIGQRLLYPHGHKRVPGKMIWWNADHRALNKQSLVKYLSKHSIQIENPMVAMDIQRGSNFIDSDIGYADAYVATGTFQNIGSGRSLILGTRQIKGVGPTRFADVIGSQENIDGRLHPASLFAEIVNGLRLKCLLSSPPIIYESIIRTHSGAYLGVRPGSPFRLGHLLFFETVKPRYGNSGIFKKQLAYLLHDLFGNQSAQYSLSSLSKYFDQMIEVAIQQTAESRFFGLRLTNWADNYDIFGRSFDHEEVQFCFNTAPVRGLAHDTIIPTHSQYSWNWFADLDININSPLEAQSLQSIKCAFSCIQTISRLLEIDTTPYLKRRWNWDRLERTYQRIIQQLFEDAFGRAASHSAVRSLIRANTTLKPSKLPLRTDLILKEMLKRGDPSGPDPKLPSSEARLASLLSKYSTDGLDRRFWAKLRSLESLISSDRLDLDIRASYKRLDKERTDLVNIGKELEAIETKIRSCQNWRQSLR